MIQQNVFEYLVNSLWQLPLLLLAAWLVVRIARPGLAAQHIVWLAALALGVLLPLRGIDWNGETDAAPAIAMDFATIASEPIALTPRPQPQGKVAPLAQQLTTLRVRSIHIESRTISWLIDLYAVSAAWGLARLVHGWFAARRLVASAEQHPLTTLESALLRSCAQRLGLSADRVPEVRFLSDPEACPMVVGIRRPVLLLPASLRHTGALAFDDARLMAVLLHELTHVRRRDYLANLIARTASLPIAYHPAAQAIHRRIRQTREMICDAHAADAFPSPCSYARSLLALAESIVSPQLHVEAVGLFDHTRNSLEERIMKLTEPKLPVSITLRAARIIAGAAVLVAGTGVAATLHVKAATPLICALQTPQAPPAPAAPAVDVGPAAPQVPAPAPAPAPAPTPAPTHPAGAIVVDGQQVRQLTPEEQRDIDQQVQKVRVQMKELNLQLKVMPQIKIPPIDLKGIQDLKIQVHSPEFRQPMEDLKKTMNSPEFQQQMAEAANNASKAEFNSAEFKQRMDELHRQLNSPEFKQQIEDAKRLSLQMNVDSAEARKQLADASAAIAEAQKQVHDVAVQKKLDEAQRRLQEATKSIP
jgi:beta-lactamase regulating signal transducer with metallopeptidase domain